MTWETCQGFFHLLAIKLDADQIAIPDAREEGPSLNDTERDRYACPGPASSSLGSEKELALSYNNLRLAGDFKCLCIIRFSLNLYNCCHMFGMMFQNLIKPLFLSAGRLELIATRKEITLLLTSHSSMWDIGEVHLKYERSNFLDCGMPTLKNFTRPSDWERVLRKIHESKRSASNGDGKAYFTKPLCLRLPSSSTRGWVWHSDFCFALTIPN